MAPPGFCLFLFLCALCTLSGCPRREAQKQAAPDGGAEDALAALLAEQLGGELAFSPVTATWLGDHRFDDRLDDVREAAIRSEIQRLRGLLDRLRRLREESPSVPALDHLLLSSRVRAQLLELQDLRPQERSPVFYMTIVSGGIDGLLGPDFGEARLRALTRRLKAVPDLCREAQRSLKNPPELQTRRAIELGQATADFLGTLLPRLLRSVATDKLLDEALRASDEARRALGDFVAWLSRDLLPRSKGEWALGREMLLARLSALEQLDVPLELLLGLGEREVRDTRAQLDEAARRVSGAGSAGRPLEAALRAIEEDHPRPEELVRSVEETMGALFAAVTDGHLLTLPAARPRVQELPPYRWGYLVLHLPGPLETRAREALLYVDPVDAGWTDKRQVQEHLRALGRAQQQLVLGHEVVPGRFVQQELLQKAALPLVRRRTRSLGFVEGWAHYAEGLLPSVLPEREADRLRVLVLRARLWRLGRLVVALRMHGGARPMSVEDAARYLAEECALDDYAARREAERAALDPLVLLPALGRLQLLKLRRDYAEQEGERFSLQAFHDLLLQKGELPVWALRQILLSDPGPSLELAPE